MLLLIKIKYHLKRLEYKLLVKFGFKKQLLKNRYGEQILVFHGIDTYGETKYNSRFVSVAYFEAFIAHISKHYNVISVNDFFDKKFKPNTLNLAITFDDGYLNNYKYAVPILEKYNVPASFYITTIHDKDDKLWADYLDLVSYYTEKSQVNFQKKTYKKTSKNEFIFNKNSLKNTLKTVTYDAIETIYKKFEDDWKSLSTKENLSDYWRLMTSNEIKEISQNPLFSIGAHAQTHASLKHISLEEAKEEILNSKAALEAICNINIDEFAFPFGHYTNELTDYSTSIGFKKLLLVDYNNETDNEKDHLKNRFVINPYVCLDIQLAFLLKGRYF